MGETSSPAGKLPAAPEPGKGLSGTGGEDGFGGFGKSFLADSVGRGGANLPDDVHTASSFLHANGYLPAPTKEATEEFHRAVEAGQEKLNNLSGGGLLVDGRVTPFGPTEVLSQRAVTSRQMHGPAIRDASDQASPTSPSLADGLTDDRKLIRRIEAEYARDDTYLNRLPEDVRAFYTGYQTHLRTQPYTTDRNALALQERNALTAGREAAGATRMGPAFMQGLLNTGPEMAEGLGQLTGSRRLLDAATRLRNRIEAAFPVPEPLRGTDSVQSAATLGSLAPTAATGALGVMRGALAKTGAAVASGAIGAGRASQDIARQGANLADQRIAAFVGAVSEGLGPQAGSIAAKQGAGLMKKHLGLDLTGLATGELAALNSMLAPQGVNVALDGAIRVLSRKPREGTATRP